MDRRCAAGALLALAACIASSAAAPTASNQTALDFNDGAPEGCYYNFQHYGEGDRIMTNEPCLNCTCHNRMLMCYLRVCPFTKPIGQDCSVEKRADQCCPIVTCPDVPVDLLTSTSTTSPAEFGETGVGKLDRYGCSINGKYFSEGSKVPSTPNKPCEHCYCIRNMTTCVMQECTLHVDGCTPIYHKEVCCPVRYSCDHPEDEIPLLDDMTTTVRPTPGFLLTTTTLSPVTQMTQDCVHDDKIFADGALIKTEKACEHCYCMKGDIVCVVQECGTPMENEGKNCSSMPPREGQCCPDTYICEGDELSAETKPDFSTTPQLYLEELTTVNPPRRTIEGSGYRSESDEPFTVVPNYKPDHEGSGEEPESFKPIDDEEMLIPEKETSPPFIGTEHDEIIDEFSTSTPKITLSDSEIIDKATTEPDKGENTVPSGIIDEHSSEPSVKVEPTIGDDKSDTNPPVHTTESYADVKRTEKYGDMSSVMESTATEANAIVTEAVIDETTVIDYNSPSSTISKITVDNESIVPTEPTREIISDKFNVSTTETETKELTTKATDDSAPDIFTTESASMSVVEEDKTTTVQSTVHDSYQENEVLIKEQTTESITELLTESGDKNMDNEPATTKLPEIITELTTPSKGHFVDSTSINTVDNEIDEESYPTPFPGRIPGEGDCLLDGVTYSNESVVPSSNNCHTDCRCVSSIVKCDPIICSAPPDYMDNCQPMYDPPDSCCPTYVCDHTKETVPPQPHSQMSGTESPMQPPGIECNGDQCEVNQDKEDHKKPSDSCTSEACSENSSKKPHECGAGGCHETPTKSDNEPHSSDPTQECKDEKCELPQKHCPGGNCEIPIEKDQTCNNENGCRIPPDQLCQGEECKTHPENIPVTDSTAICDNSGDCKEMLEKQPNCEGESCISSLPPKIEPSDTEGCKEGSDCSQPSQGPIEQCNDESCKRQQVPEFSKPATSECNNSECTSENASQKTDVPEIDKEFEAQTTESPGLYEIQTEETVTSRRDFDESGSRSTTESSSEVNNEEPTTKYPESEVQKVKEPSQPPIIPTSSVETPEEHDSHTETVILTESTVVPQEEITKSPNEQTSKDVPMDTDNDDITTEPPRFDEHVLPELVTKPDQILVDDRESGASVTEDTNINKNSPDVATKAPFEPTKQDDFTKIIQDTTKSQDLATAVPEQESTKEQEYTTVLDENHTDRPGTESSPVETKEPDNVHESITTESIGGTETPGQLSTDKFIEQPMDNESQEIATTPEPHDSKTSKPEVLETNNAGDDIAPSTTAPEKLGTLPQEEVEFDDKVSLTPEVPSATSPNDMVSVTEGITSTYNELETKSPISDFTEVTPKPESSIDKEGSNLASEPSAVNDEKLVTKTPDEDMTEVPELQSEEPKLDVTKAQEKTTKLPDVITVEQEPEIQSAVTSPAISTDGAQTDAPLSIVKEHGDEETSTQPTDIDIHDLNKEKPEFSESSTPHSDVSESIPETSDKPDKDIEPIPSLNVDDKVDKETEKTSIKTTMLPEVKDVSSTEQSTIELNESEKTTISTPEANKDEEPVPVTIVEEPSSSEHPEPAVSENDNREPETPQIETTEVIEGEISTKSPEPFTEIPAPTTRDQPTEDNDIITDIPELTIHEHPESSVTTKEPEQSIPEVTETPQGENIKTNAPPISEIEVDTEITKEPQSEITTVASEHPPTEQSDFIVKDKTPSIQETSVTDFQKETTKVPEQVDNLSQSPELPKIEPQRDSTETPGSLEVTKIPKVSATDSTTEITEAPESQHIVTNVPDSSATSTNKIIAEENTQAPYFPDTSTVEPTKESTDVLEPLDMATKVPELSETSSLPDVTKAPAFQDNSTEISELQSPGHDSNVPEKFATESQKDAEVTDLPLPAKEISESTETESDKDVTEIPVTQESVTSLPKVSSIKPEDEASKAPEIISTQKSEIVTPKSEEEEQYGTGKPVAQETVTNIPVVPSTETQKEVTEDFVVHDAVTKVPETSVPELQTDVTEKPVLRETAIPEIPVTETEMQATKAPLPHDDATNIPVSQVTEIPETQDIATKKPEIDEESESTRPSEVQDSKPEIPSQEILTEVTLAPEIQDTATDATKPIIMESPEKVTDVPMKQDIATNAPESSVTEIHKEETEEPIIKDFVTDSPKITDTELEGTTEVAQSQDTETEVSDKSETEPLAETTRASEPPEIVTSAPEVSTIEPHREVTESLEQDLVSKAPERTHTEVDEQKESVVTEKGESVTLEDHTEPQPTKLDTDLLLPVESEVPNEQSTMHPQPSETESPNKVSDLDTTKDKVNTDVAGDKDDTNKKEVTTESFTAEPTMIPEHVDPEKSDGDTESTAQLEPLETSSKTPQISDAGSDVTNVPEMDITDRKEFTTESYPQETRSTESTEHSKPLDSSSPPSEDLQPTSETKDEYDVVSTTPYLVLLDEHTHKNDIYTGPGDETTMIPSEVSSDYEPSTPESFKDKITEPAPSVETEMPTVEESHDEDQSIEKITVTAISPVITTISPVTELDETQKVPSATQPQDLESNEISTSAPTPGQEQSESEKPSTSNVGEEEKEESLATEKPRETTAPEEEFILATTKASVKVEEELTTLSPITDKFGKPEETLQPNLEKPKPNVTEEMAKPGVHEVQTTEEPLQPEDDTSATGAAGYGQEPDYGDDDQAFGPGTCRYGGKVYVSAQQIPRDDPCDFCFCFRSDIICLQQSCPPPIHGCHEEPIQGFCCPRYECPVSMATTLNVTTTTTTTTTTLPPHFLHHAYKGAAERKGCQIKGHTYKVGDVVRASSGPCLHCTCGGDGQMKCDPKVCTPEPMLRQMIAAAVSAKRRR